MEEHEETEENPEKKERGRDRKKRDRLQEDAVRRCAQLRRVDATACQCCSCALNSVCVRVCVYSTRQLANLPCGKVSHGQPEVFVHLFTEVSNFNSRI